LVTQYAFDLEKLTDILRAHDVKTASLFGSMARGEATDESDIDLLVEFSTGKSLLFIVRLERVLSAALGRKVDLLTEKAISPYLLPMVEKDLQVIYDQG